MFSCLAHLGPLDGGWQLSDFLDWAKKVEMPPPHFNCHLAAARSAPGPAAASHQQPCLAPEQPKQRLSSTVSANVLLAAADAVNSPSFWSGVNKHCRLCPHTGHLSAAAALPVSRQNGMATAMEPTGGTVSAEHGQSPNNLILQAIVQTQKCVQEQAVLCQNLQLKQDALVQQRFLQQNIKALLVAQQQQTCSALPSYPHRIDATQQLQRIQPTSCMHLPNSGQAIIPEHASPVPASQLGTPPATHTNGSATPATPSELPPLHRPGDSVSCGSVSLSNNSAFLAAPASVAVPISKGNSRMPGQRGLPVCSMPGDREHACAPTSTAGGAVSLAQSHPDGPVAADADRSRLSAARAVGGTVTAVPDMHGAPANLQGWHKAVQRSAGLDSDLNRDALLSLLQATGNGVQQRGRPPDMEGDGVTRQLAM
jgi:uncharacterized Zn-binding protein involved in type VI secretion